MLTVAGQWVELASDPLAPFADIPDGDEQCKAAGYTAWGTLGPKDMCPLWLEVFRRNGGQDSDPQFMVVICNHGYYETVYADSPPAMMNVQAQWAPMIQAAAVTHLLGELEDSGSFSDFANLVRKGLGGSYQKMAP